MSKRFQPIWCFILLAGISGGCAHSRLGRLGELRNSDQPFPATPTADKSPKPTFDNSVGQSTPSDSSSDKVTLARATEPLTPTTPPAREELGTTLPGVTVSQQQQQQPAQWPATIPVQLPSAVGPNVRSNPTVLGAALNLGPNEQPLDRVLELTRQIEARDIENKVLQARIKTLEANAKSREDSLNESLREVETATTEVVKARNEMAALRKEIAIVRSKLSLAEKDEIETLKLIVEALEKVLQSEGKR
jgi:hypothetical protein